MKKVLGTCVLAAICAGFATFARAMSEAEAYQVAYDAGQYIGCSVLAAAINLQEGLSFEDRQSLRMQARVMSEHGRQVLYDLPDEHLPDAEVESLYENLVTRAVGNVATALEQGTLTKVHALNCDALYAEIN